MTRHLQETTSEVRERVEALGGDTFVTALADSIEGQEDAVLNWFDADEEDRAADEILDWGITDVVAFGGRLAYAEVRAELSTYSSVNDDEEGMLVTEIPVFLRVQLKQPLDADRLEFEFKDLCAWVEADYASGFHVGPLSDGAIRAELVNYLEGCARRTPSRGAVLIRETDDGLEVHGLPGPASVATDPRTEHPAGDEMRRRFVEAGLSEPPVPAAVEPALQSPEEWLFATREMDPVDMYLFEPYLIEVLAAPVEDYFALSHAGHGTNSFAINYQLVFGPIALFAQVPWGGIYMDPQASAAEVDRLFQECRSTIAAAEKLATDVTTRLLICESAMRGIRICEWLPQPVGDEASAQAWLEEAKSAAPQGRSALTRALARLAEPS